MSNDFVLHRFLSPQHVIIGRRSSDGSLLRRTTRTSPLERMVNGNEFYKILFLDDILSLMMFTTARKVAQSWRNLFLRMRGDRRNMIQHQEIERGRRVTKQHTFGILSTKRQVWVEFPDSREKGTTYHSLLLQWVLWLIYYRSNDPDPWIIVPIVQYSRVFLIGTGSQFVSKQCMVTANLTMRNFLIFPESLEM